ncbi:MAG: deiodinase-like protein [Methylotenera sp.]
MQKENNYRYGSFTLGTVLTDMAFNGGVKPDAQVGKIKLTTTDAQLFEWPRANSPPLLLLVFGSRSCPATISSIPDIKNLYTQYGNEVEFAYLYVREAHPGEHIPQPQTMQDKTVQACALQNEYDIPWKVAVDTLYGEVHHLLATRPNAAYLIDATGKVVFRTLFAANANVIKKAIQQHLNDKPIAKQERSPVVYPVLKLIGLMWAVLGKAGTSAQRDLLLHTPFIYLPSRIATLLSVQSPFARGSIAMALTIVIFALITWAIIGYI